MGKHHWRVAPRSPGCRIETDNMKKTMALLALVSVVTVAMADEPVVVKDMRQYVTYTASLTKNDTCTIAANPDHLKQGDCGEVRTKAPISGVYVLCSGTSSSQQQLTSNIPSSGCAAYRTCFSGRPAFSSTSFVGTAKRACFGCMDMEMCSRKSLLPANQSTSNRADCLFHYKGFPVEHKLNGGFLS